MTSSAFSGHFSGPGLPSARKETPPEAHEVASNRAPEASRRRALVADMSALLLTHESMIQENVGVQQPIVAEQLQGEIRRTFLRSKRTPVHDDGNGPGFARRNLDTAHVQGKRSRL